MAVTFPRDKPASLRFSNYTFGLRRMQELHPLRSARTIAVDLGPSVWAVTASVVPRNETDLGAIRAFFDTLSSIEQAYFYDPLREYPLAYRLTGWLGGFTGVCTLASVAANNVEIGLSGLPSGFVLSPGDYIPWDYGTDSRALHRVVVGGTASGGGTLSVEVRPHVRPGWAVGPTASLYKPSARMFVVPDTYDDPVDPRRLSTPSFQAIQTL